ncbi:hypothetical protein ScPMuIL_004832 [Solemya velum]
MFKNPRSRVIRLLCWGVVVGVIATVLCKASKDDGWIPVNKNLWSLSFVLALSGLAFILLTFCYLSIDVWHIWSGAPFYYPGMNAIVLYMGHEILATRFPVRWKVTSEHSSELAIACWGTAFWTFVAVMLFFNEIFIAI